MALLTSSILETLNEQERKRAQKFERHDERSGSRERQFLGCELGTMGDG